MSVKTNDEISSKMSYGHILARLHTPVKANLWLTGYRGTERHAYCPAHSECWDLKFPETGLKHKLGKHSAYLSAYHI